MVGTYNGWLVTLSIVVAIVSSYVALDLGSRVTSAQGYNRAPYWLVGGALSLGSGIWSMHFIGMLAYKLPIPTSYDLTLTLLSLALPVLTSGFGLYMVSRHTMKPFALLGGGMLIGVGIAAMHYTGMAAMKMQPPIHYRIPWVALSIFIAVSASVASLWSAFRLRMETILSAFWKKAGSAMVLGAAIAGMHYTGMVAAVFAPNSVCTVSSQNIDNVWLANAVGGLCLLFLAITLLISAFDAYVAEHSLRHADVLHRVNVDLERRTAALAREAEVRARTEDALREAHADLEERVAQRTSELAHANQALRHEMAERSAAHHHLQQSEARLRALSRQLVAVQEAERDRLSRELHDRVGQNLTALGINLDILRIALDSGERPELLARLQDSIALLDATVEAIENVMSELRPPMLDEYGLLPALEWYGREFSQRTGVEVGVSATSHAERPAPDVEITLLRIVAEALNNVVKHAGATRVEIEIETSGEEYAMIVSDNGVGFDPDANPRPGRGIRTMRQRAQALGGALEIRAMPGNGTTIIARIPL